MANRKDASHNSFNVKYIFHITVFLCITFLFGKIDPVEPLTPYGMNTIGVFLGVIYAWVFIDIIWPSMVGLLALMLLDVMPSTVLLNKGFGDPTVLMMLFIFVFSATLDRWGLSKYISMWFVSRKCVAGRPWALTFALLLAVAILGGLTSATPAAVIGWGLLYGIFNLCGYKKGDGYPVMMIIGSVFAAQLGMALIPFKSIPLVAISAYEKLSGTTVDYAIYMSSAVVACVLCLFMFILLCKFLFQPDVSKLTGLDITSILKEEEMTLTGVQKLLLGCLVALIICMMLPGFLPKDLAVTIFFKKIGNTGVCILLVALLAALRSQGKPVLQWRPMVNEGVAWPIIFILAFTLPLSGPISDPGSGITAFMLEMLDPILGSFPEYVVLLCMGAVGVLMTQFVNNTAMVVAIMPVVNTYCINNNVSSELPVTLITIACCLAFLTPAASSTAAMLHGNDWIRTKDIWKIAPLVIVLALLIVYAVVVMMGKIFIQV